MPKTPQHNLATFWKLDMDSKPTLYYCALESYVARYTYQLLEWNKRVFDRRKVNYVIVEGETLSNDQAIVTGQVLDAHGRSYYSLTQLAKLVKLMKSGKVTKNDIIFFEDMFTPGIESLPYILNQVSEEYRPKVWVRCLAQTIDPDDFVHVWGMAPWMRKYEEMVDNFVTGILATNEEMVAHMKIAGWQAPIYNISGLAFGKEEVQSRVTKINSFHERKPRVVFAARTDQEKQPHFFMDLITEWNKRYPDSGVEFAVLSGGPLRGNDPTAIHRLRMMESSGKIKIYDNLPKNEYYCILNNSRVLINTALQDWVSNTINEADALGCNVLYPAYRSFPETFANDETRMYVPWSLDDAINKLYTLLVEPSPNMGKISDWNDNTIDRTLDIMLGQGEQWNRSENNYRKFVAENKY